MDRLSTERQRELIAKLGELILERSTSEVSLKNSRAARDMTAETQYQDDLQKITSAYEANSTAVESQYHETMATLEEQFTEAERELAESNEGRRGGVSRKVDSLMTAADQEEKKARRKAEVAFVAAGHEADGELSKFQEGVEQRRQQIRQLEGKAQAIIRRRRCRREAGEVAAKPGRESQARPFDQFNLSVQAAEHTIDSFRKHSAPRFLSFDRLLIILVFASILAAVPILLAELLGDDAILAVIISLAVGIGITAIVYVFVRPIVKQQTLAAYEEFLQHVADAELSLDRAVDWATKEHQRRVDEFTARRDSQFEAAEQKRLQTEQQVSLQNESLASQVESEAERTATELKENHQRQLAATQQQYQQRKQQVESSYEKNRQELEAKHRSELDGSREMFNRSWERLVERWAGGLAGFSQAIQSLNEYCDTRFRPWDAVDWITWRPPSDVPLGLRFGHYEVDLEMFEGGLSQSTDLSTPQTRFELPALLTFPEVPSLILEAWGDGRVVANQTIRNVMLRLLTSLPPGKVRFTIIDPTGLGQNFSAFMHLADIDDRLVSNRIWTEAAHINQRMADLTEHMETVIQKYLRNEFQSINEYNEHAGEVAEPFHVLVIANFPNGFSDEAATRLSSIANSGARCGVYTLISVDSRLDLPRNFDLSDLERNAAVVQWSGDRFEWVDDDLREYPLVLEPPPSDDIFTHAVKTAGEFAIDTFRVEVPFSSVSVDEDEWWTSDSRSGVGVALGRAGASKLQYMRLGKGTSQHVLIAGKTGSGKSTLLHALITNLAIHYSPEEVQFFLVDFKKGVEFKQYAATGLPHARVVAIESEREFGLSVLERLDEELKRRGDLFREHGVQDVKGFRDANPDQLMPRLLLIVDEFQELFVADDKIAHESSLLLDRLVRQGRAFGIHALLGSQTLAGAYSLARSTIGQMAVRIALQCSEADSHLILSEDNTAARLLNRPGEAIYNDSNGTFEGNHPFQTVWLPIDERDQYLKKLGARALALKLDPPIVFEGNVPADPAANPRLRDALQTLPEPNPKSYAVWLGAAVAIKDPTAAIFRRQSASNMLIVGQQEEMATGVMANCVISLAAGTQRNGDGKNAKIFLLDGTRADAPDANFWSRFLDRTSLDVRLATPGQEAAVIGEIAGEVERRQSAADESAAPVFLFIYNMSRFRDMKRADDDFSFSFSGDDEKSANVGQQFSDILRDGPLVGVHTMIWCDNYNNVTRALDRNALREIDMRVLFQMSATDSSNLMDSPAASKLGVHRGLLFSEEKGAAEKFRPYGIPQRDWIGWVRDQLAARQQV